MGNENSGRKPKTVQTRQIQQGLLESAVLAEKKLKFSLRGTDDSGHKFRPLSNTRIKECELVINHAIGSPRQKVDMHHSGEVLTLRDLALIAFKGDTKLLPEPEPVTADLVIDAEFEEVTQDVVVNE